MSEGTIVKPSKRSENELLELESEIEKYKQQLRLLKSEEQAELEAKEEIIKKNHEKIQKLQMEIENLHSLVQKGKLSDEKILKKAFQRYPNEMGIIKGKRASEVIDVLEGRVFDMTKRRDALRYEIRKKENILAQVKEDLYNMERRCESNEEEEIDVLIVNRAREVENDYQEAQMRILEMQQIERIYQNIQQNLAADLVLLPTKLEELEGEFYKQQKEIDQLVDQERKAYISRDKAKTALTNVEASAQFARQEKEKVMAEFSHVVEQKQAHMADPDIQRRRATAFAPNKLKAEEELNQMKHEQEKQLDCYRAAFEQIKIATGVTDIEEAEKRFASQKAIKENLLNLKKRSEKMFRDLKQEKKRMDAEKETMVGANLACPEKVLDEELAKWKNTYEEQMQRKEAAEIEYERITNTIAEAKTSLWHILQMMEYHVLGPDEISSSSPDIPLNELADKVKSMMDHVMSKLKGQDVEALLMQMKEEQPILKKLEEDRLSHVTRKKQKPPAQEEESSSDEEETRKRTELKKDAQSFADIKQKQKGRGRGLKL